MVSSISGRMKQVVMRYRITSGNLNESDCTAPRLGPRPHNPASWLPCVRQRHQPHPPLNHAIMAPVLFAAVLVLFVTKLASLTAVTVYFINT
jgi:hypothetical protein